MPKLQWLKFSEIIKLITLAWLFLSTPSWAVDNEAQSSGQGERLALVIGNKDYPQKPLLNPVNDARDMKNALQKVGFRVIYRENANLNTMNAAVREFAHSLRKDSVGLFYYSGHGAQADGGNYLIPVGADITSKAELKSRAYDTNIILGEMQDIGNAINIVILDACRNNPYKGFSGNATGMNSIYGPKGSLIAFATAPGSVADDNTAGRNGLYTSYLKQYLLQPGLTIEEMFKKVRESVMHENSEQVPWETSSIIGRFCFAGCENQKPSFLTEIDGIELKYWDSIHDSKNPADYQSYLAQYPQGRFAGLARNWLNRFDAAAVRTCDYCPELTPLPTGIYMGKYEVTQAQWQAVMGANPAKFKNCGENCPVENVSWNDVQIYIQRLNQQTGKHFRLPTEQEWLSACQAGGGNNAFCGGSNPDYIAWYHDNAGPGPHPVGKKQANAWSLYDMSGNVWEWTSTCDPSGCNRRVDRGGSWLGKAKFIRADNRGGDIAAEHEADLGFRLAMDR
jgi:Sulfatase-modifying factor enzyme 1/Caspase domain